MKWKDGNLTRQIRMEDGTRPRVYMILREKEAKAYWYDLLINKTETELGKLYGEKAENIGVVTTDGTTYANKDD